MGAGGTLSDVLIQCMKQESGACVADTTREAKMEKKKLAWLGILLVGILKHTSRETADLIIEAAYPGYRIAKVRKDRGLKKKGRKEDE